MIVRWRRSSYGLKTRYGCSGESSDIEACWRAIFCRRAALQEIPLAARTESLVVQGSNILLVVRGLVEVCRGRRDAAGTVAKFVVVPSLIDALHSISAVCFVDFIISTFQS